MPARTLKPCARHGCPTLVSGVTHCDEHRLERYRQINLRRPAEQQLYGRKWKEQARLFLRANPICEACGKAAAEVDHVLAHRGDLSLFWDRDNWAALCKPCHSRKTALEDGGFGNARPAHAHGGAAQ